MCRDNPHDALNYAPPTGAIRRVSIKKRRCEPLRYNLSSLRDLSVAKFLPDINSFDLTTKQSSSSYEVFVRFVKFVVNCNQCPVVYEPRILLILQINKCNVP